MGRMFERRTSHRKSGWMCLGRSLVPPPLDPLAAAAPLESQDHRMAAEATLDTAKTSDDRSLPLQLRNGLKVSVPDYTGHLSQGVFQDVYEPSDDSWLFLDTLYEELPFLQTRLRQDDDPPDAAPADGILCLEIGIGSGIVSSHLHWVGTPPPSPISPLFKLIMTPLMPLTIRHRS